MQDFQWVFYNPLNALWSTPSRTTARPKAYIYDKNIFELSLEICAWRPIEKNSYIVDKERKKNTYCTASSYLQSCSIASSTLYPPKPSELVPLSTGHPHWRTPPSSSPSFSSLSSTLGFVMGGVPLGVSFSTCCLCKWRNSSIERVDFLTWVANALALF